MTTFKIASHLGVCDLASAVSLAPWEKEFEIPAKSRSSKQEVLRIASHLIKQGIRSALEVNVNGVRRSQRAPLVCFENDKVHFFKICASPDRLDRAIYIVQDLLVRVAQNKQCALTSEGFVICTFTEDASEYSSSLAGSLNVLIVREANLDGLFD